MFIFPEVTMDSWYTTYGIMVLLFGFESDRMGQVCR